MAKSLRAKCSTEWIGRGNEDQGTQQDTKEYYEDEEERQRGRFLLRLLAPVKHINNNYIFHRQHRQLYLPNPTNTSDGRVNEDRQKSSTAGAGHADLLLPIQCGATIPLNNTVTRIRGLSSLSLQQLYVLKSF